MRPDVLEEPGPDIKHFFAGDSTHFYSCRSAAIAAFIADEARIADRGPLFIIFYVQAIKTSSSQRGRQRTCRAQVVACRHDDLVPIFRYLLRLRSFLQSWHPF